MNVSTAPTKTSAVNRAAEPASSDAQASGGFSGILMQVMQEAGTPLSVLSAAPELPSEDGELKEPLVEGAELASLNPSDSSLQGLLDAAAAAAWQQPAPQDARQVSVQAHQTPLEPQALGAAQPLAEPVEPPAAGLDNNFGRLTEQALARGLENTEQSLAVADEPVENPSRVKRQAAFKVPPASVEQAVSPLVSSALKSLPPASVSEDSDVQSTSSAPESSVAKSEAGGSPAFSVSASKPQEPAQPSSWLQAIERARAQESSAPAAPMQASVDEPLANVQAWSKAMAKHVVVMMRDGVAEAVVKINPERLGPVDIRVGMGMGKVDVEFSSPYQEVRDVLQSSLKTLDGSMSEAGIVLSKVEVKDSMASFNAQNDFAKNQNKGHSQQQEQRRGEDRRGSGFYLAEEELEG